MSIAGWRQGRLVLFLAALLLPAVATAQSQPATPRAAAEARAASEARTAPAARSAADARAAAEAMAATRAELRDAQRELERLSQRVAVLAQRAGSADIARALDAPPFARPGLGIVMAPADDGVRLAAVTPGSPAAKAGLRGGDVLVAVQGKRLEGDDGGALLDRARALVGTLEEGDTVTLGYLRGDSEHTATLQAELLPGLAWMRDFELLRGQEMPGLHALRPMVAPRIHIEPGSFAPFAGCGEDGDCGMGWFAEALRWRGLRLAEVDTALGRYFGVDRGVLVLKAEGDGLEALQPGDVILAVQGADVDTPAEAMERIGRAGPGEQLSLLVQRDRRRDELALTLPQLSRWQLLAPPAPPVPPAPPAPPAPRTPRAAPPAPPAPGAPPAPPAPPAPAAPAPPGDGVLERVLM